MSDTSFMFREVLNEKLKNPNETPKISDESNMRLNSLPFKHGSLFQNNQWIKLDSSHQKNYSLYTYIITIKKKSRDANKIPCRIKYHPLHAHEMNLNEKFIIHFYSMHVLNSATFLLR